MLYKKLKSKWVVMYEIEVSTPYGIDECTVAIYGTVSTYGFVSTTNHWVQTIRATRKDFFTELGNQFRVQGLS